MTDPCVGTSTKPKVSVVTVVYNNASTIEDTIRSIIAQTYLPVEHIVIDGVSTDGTLDILRRYEEKIAIIRSEPDQGMYDAMNKGLKLATGDIVGFLNADDVYAGPHVLKDIVEIIESRQVDACYGDLVYVDKQDSRKITRYWKSRPFQDGLFENGWMPAHPTFYARKSVYDRFGSFDLAYPRQSDFELTLRLLAVHRIATEYIPKLLVRMRSGGASRGFSHILEGNIEAYRACRSHGLQVTPFFIIKKILSRIPQFFYRDHLGTLS